MNIRQHPTLVLLRLLVHQYLQIAYPYINYNNKKLIEFLAIFLRYNLHFTQ